MDALGKSDCQSPCLACSEVLTRCEQLDLRSRKKAKGKGRGRGKASTSDASKAAVPETTEVPSLPAGSGEVATEVSKKVRKSKSQGSKVQAVKSKRKVLKRHQVVAKKTKKPKKKKVVRSTDEQNGAKANRVAKGNNHGVVPKAKAKRKPSKPSEKAVEKAKVRKSRKITEEVKTTVKRGPKQPAHEFEGEPTTLEDQRPAIWAELSRQWKSGKAQLTGADFEPASFLRTSVSSYWKRDMPAVGLKTKGKAGKTYAYFSFPRELAVNIGVALHCARVVVPDSSVSKHLSRCSSFKAFECLAIGGVRGQAGELKAGSTGQGGGIFRS